MKLTWHIDSEDVARLKKLQSEEGHRTFVRNRIRHNIENRRRDVPPRGEIWQKLIGCLLTTQQRSGPDGAVQRFLSLDPFPLGLDRCLASRDRYSLVFEALTDFGGLRRTKTNATFAEHNLAFLEDGGWDHLSAQLDLLIGETDRGVERSVARHVAGWIKGFGPKQARNFLQWLRLTRYEIPLDSRIVRWLNQNGFPIHLTAQPLSDAAYFEFVLDGVQELCSAADLFPCEFDALVFASFDEGDWDDRVHLW